MNTRARLAKLEARFIPPPKVIYGAMRVEPGYSGPVYLHEETDGPRAGYQVWETYPTENGLTKEGQPSREMFYQSRLTS